MSGPLPPRTGRLAWSALAATLLLVPFAAQAGNGAGGDIALGVARFHFAQRDFRAAVTDLTAGILPGDSRWAEERNLLLGRADLRLGLTRSARATLRDLLNGTPAPQVRVQTAFFLGRLLYQQGQYREAADLLVRNPRVVPPTRETERLYLLTQAYLAQGAFGQARRTITALESAAVQSGHPDWAAFARYNLGVALINAGRLDDGDPHLVRLGDHDPTAPEAADRIGPALRDRANLALGYARLRAGNIAAALPPLRRVRLRGPASADALLALGWGEQRAARPRRALVAWLALTERPFSEPAVQEAMLCVPNTLEQLGARREALTRYQAALAGYNQQLQHLDTARAAVRGTALLDALRSADPAAPVPPLGAALAPYLDHLLARTEFQRAWRDYRQLVALRARVDHWAEQLPVFEVIVRARRADYAARRPLMQSGTLTRRLSALREQRRRLTRRLDALLAADGPAALADAEQHRHLQRLDALGAELKHLPPGLAAPLQPRLNLLRGVLRWRLVASYPARRKRLQQALADLDGALSKAERHHEGMQRAWAALPATFQGFDERLSEQRTRITTTRRELSGAIDAAGNHLRQLALRELDRRRRHVASLRARAQFSLARLYDSLASDEDEGT
ncbi:MAG TPA: hypothetical protein VKA50_05800 [Gammaproteobacteria bacterium]|nr:hypothetical protein [Gammaproteobacteria bacterium]